MRTCYETSDGEIFYSQEKAKEHELKIEENKINDMANGNKAIAKYLNTWGGRSLLKSHDLNEVAIWEVGGEDPNCDLGGHHHNPHLFTAKGKLMDVIAKAVETPGFWQWGGGGTITKAKIEYLNMDTGETEIVE